MVTYLIAGLGNPGEKYRYTRHNLGFLVVEQLAEQYQIDMKKKSLGFLGTGVMDNAKIILVMPTTYMNQSGQAVRHYRDYYKVPHENMMVLVDDTELPFGRMRLRTKGGTGGHNGLKSIEEHLGTDEYPRLRIGIGLVGDMASYVLKPFSPKEKEVLPQVISEAALIVKKYFCESRERAIEQASLFELRN